MPPDARKFREHHQQAPGTLLLSSIDEEQDDENNQNNVTIIMKVDDNEENVECMSSVVKRIVMDFPCMEQPVRCVLTTSCNNNKSKSSKRLSSNAKGSVFASSSSCRSDNDEFTLLPESDGTFVFKSTKHNRFLCSDAKGVVYSAETRHGDLEKWTVTESPNNGGGFNITSTCFQRNLVVCDDNKTIRTVDDQKQQGPTAVSTTWSVEFNSGELCFLSSPCMDMRIRCDLVGKLSMTKNYKGWEAWRFAEAGNGYVRISPYAHSHKFLCSNDKGVVYTTHERKEEWEKNSLWSIQKAPPGQRGVVIQSAAHGRFLKYEVNNTKSFSTTHDTFFLLEESSIWQLESAHRQTYYLVCSHNDQRIGTEGPYAHGPRVYTTAFPIRNNSEEWKIEGTDERGVVTLVSQARNEYLASTECGKVFATCSPPDDDDDSGNTHKWVLEESSPEEEGGAGHHYLVSKITNRYLACYDGGQLRTVTKTDPCKGKLWRLEPRLPRQVTEAKIKSLATAVTVGLVGTLTAPVILGGAIGLMGIAEAGVTVQVVTGSIRAAEAISTISRISSSSSSLMRSSSSSMLAASNVKRTATASRSDNSIANRPFCAWSSW